LYSFCFLLFADPPSGQEVTLTTVTPHQRLRVVTITPDAGLLRCIPIADAGASSTSGSHDWSEDRYAATATAAAFRARLAQQQQMRGPQYVDLQPDGNSFDLMAGMIKKKV
jgi:biotin--protein ligase